MKLPQKLLFLLELRDRTQAQLARATGMNQSTLSSICGAKNGPKNAKPRRLRADEALRVARELDVPLEWLVDDTAGPPVPMPPSELREITKLANDLGFAVAKARLLGVPEVKPAPGQEVYRPPGGMGPKRPNNKKGGRSA